MWHSLPVKGLLWDQIWIKSGTRGSWIRFQSHPSGTRVATVERRVVNPLAKGLVMSQCVANLQSEVTGVRVDEARADPSMPAMPVNERQFRFAHFPDLLHQIGQ